MKHKVLRYDSIRKSATGQGDNYTFFSSLGCNYFKSLIRFKFDLSKIQALDSDPKAIQHINFPVSLAQQALKNRRKQVL